MTLSLEDANRLAALLNQVSSATVKALLAEEPQRALEVTSALRDLHGQLEEGSEIAPFIEVLLRWLEGQRPEDNAVQHLDPLFQRALRAMREQVPLQMRKTRADPAQEPISRRVLSQLVAAVVAAKSVGDAQAQRQLAAQLVTIQGKLGHRWRKRIGPLLENLRGVLGGTDPRVLPDVPDAAYQKIWVSARDLLLGAHFDEASARDQLLERLAHNTLFIARSKNPELTEHYLRALLEVQRQALESQAPTIATLVGAIRAYLQGLDPTPFVALLDGAEATTWQKVMTELDH
ncbi:MAG: hypothetical protein H0T73_16280 [Ardenticatenales bacterium]|nr:hypothetical protein [Ardenticatenales bacterium]